MLQIRTESPPAYAPGHVVTVMTDLRRRLWRTCSVADAPAGDGVLELYARARDGGPVSGALVRHTTVESVLRLGPPLGPWSSRDVYLSGAREDVLALRQALVQGRVLEARITVEEFTPSSSSPSEAVGAQSA